MLVRGAVAVNAAPREEDWPLEADTRIDPWTAERHRQIAKLVFDKCGVCNVLDVGCGTGPVLRRIPNGPDRELFGVDIDDERLRFARKADPRPGVKYINADALDPHLFPSAYFDAVLLCEILEHLPNDVAAGLVRNALKWKRHPGLLVITVPNDRLLDPHEFQTFTKEDVEALIGFSLNWESNCPDRWLFGWRMGDVR